jgi:hypothetical protein
MCFSAGGRYADVGSNSASAAAAALAGAYRVTPQLRIGAFLDQDVTSKDATQVSLGYDVPLMGLFGVWNQNENGMGLSARVSAGFGDYDMSTVRSGFGPAQVGDTRFYSRGASGMLSYTLPLNRGWTVAPYLGLRDTELSRAGYTDRKVAPFSFPFTYATLNDRQVTGLAGLHLSLEVSPHVTLTAGAGLEHDLSRQADMDAGRGLVNTGLFTFTAKNVSANFTSTYRPTRGVLDLGGSYDLGLGRKLVADLSYQQDAYLATNTAAAVAAYQIGF